MSREATKTRAVLGARADSWLSGNGLDVGCGDDPILPTVDRFDKADGDANDLSRYVTKSYDFVFASHVLEHMEDPRHALEEWLSVVRPGGHLVVIVPDEDLYEQGSFPSMFNDDHKHTFTISKTRSWSPVSVNVLDLVRGLDAEVISVELQDHGYDRRLLRHSPSRRQLRLLTAWRRISRWLRMTTLKWLVDRLFVAAGAPVDQTAFSDDRLAQIQFVVRKRV